jgi:hypothetical protein
VAPKELRVRARLLRLLRARLNKTVNMPEPLQRSLNYQDTDVVGADPLAEKLHDTQGTPAGGIGINGQGLASLARFVGDASISYGNTDSNLAIALLRGAR